MAYIDEVVEKNKRYLTQAQVDALAAASRQYNAQNAAGRASAQASAREQYDIGYRGLQNMGLAGSVSGAPTSGEVPRLKSRISAPFEDYNRRLRDVENRRLNALGGQFAVQTQAEEEARAAAEREAAARRAAAEAEQQRQAALRQAQLSAAAVVSKIQTAVKQQTAVDAATKAQLDGMKRTAALKQTTINSANVAGAKRTEQAQQQIAQDQMEIRAVAQLTGVKAASDSAAVKAANAAQDRGEKLTSRLTGKEADTSSKIEYRTMTPYERAEQTKLEREAENQNNTVSFFKKTGGETESAQKALDQFKAGLNGYDAKADQQAYEAAQKKVDDMDEAMSTGAWEVPSDVYQQAVAQRNAAKLKAEDPDTYALLVVASSDLSKEEKNKAATSFIGKKFDKVDMDDAAQKFRNADQTYSRMLAEWEKEVGNAEQREKTLSELEDQYLHYKSILDIVDNPDLTEQDRAHARESLGVGGALTEEEARDMVAKYESFGQMPEKLQQAKEVRAAAELRYKHPEIYRATQILQYKDLLEDVSPGIVSDAAKIVSDYKLGQMFNAPAMSDEEYDSQKKDVKNVRDILRQIENAQYSYDNAGEAETEDIVSDKEHAKNDLDAAVRELQEKYGMTYEQANEWVEKFEIERDRRSEYNYYMPGMLAQTEHNGEKPTQPANEKEVNNIYRAVNGMQAVYFPEPTEGETENTSIAQYMTDEQKDAYNAIYEKDGLDAANQYYHDIVPYLNIQRAQQDEEKYREFADKHPVLASIASVGANMLWNIPAAAENLITGIQGMFTEERPYYDLNSDWSFRSNRADVIRSEVSQNILSNMNRPEWANTILNSAYQTGMSMADSAAAMGFAIRGADWAVYALFSSSAGMSAYKDARARGATQDQALTLGILSGAAESIFEELSLEHLISMDYTGRGALIKNILSQAGVEGSEELTTGLANFLSDLYVMRDKSEYNDAVQKYLGEGVSKNTAEIRALLDQAAEIGLEGLGGAVSGALFGVGGKIANEVSYKKYGSQLRNSSETIKRYSDLANLLGPETQKALAEYNENPTDRNAGKLYFAVNQAINGMLETQATDDTANDQMIDQSTALAALVSGEQMNAATAEGIMKAMGAETISGMGYDSSNSQAFADSYNSRLDEFKIQAKPGEITPRLKTNKEMKQATDRMLKSLRPSEERVWKDPDLGYAVTDDGRRIKTFPGNMTGVSAEEQKSSNYAARTMAVSGNVTYQIAGMEAREGLSDAQKISEIKKNLSREYKNKAEFYEKISKALPGVSFIVHDTMGMADGAFDKTTNSIHVSLSGRQSALRVTAHELTHLMKENAFEAYGELRQAIIDEIGQDRFERMCQQKAEEYTRAGDPIDYNTKAGKELAEDETIAELCERMLNDSDWIERFCEEHTQAARTLSDYILKIVNAIKAALKDMTNRDFGSSWSGIIQAQNTFEKWGAALNTALENIANGTTQETAREQTNAKRAAEETAQAESTEQSDELYRSTDDIRAEEAKKAAEESAQKKTYVPGFKAAEVEHVLEAGIFGDKSNYEGDDYEQARAMIAQLIPDMVSLLKKEGDIDAVVEKTKAAVGKMLDNYFEDDGDMAALREAIPSVIGVDSTAKGDLKAQDQSLFQMSAKLSKALGHPVTLVSEQNAKGQKNAKYSSAEKLEEVWERVRDQFGLSDDQDFSIDTTKLLDFIEQQADTRKTFDDLYGKQRQEIITSTAVDILQAVKDMYSEKTGERFSLDTDYMRLAEKQNLTSEDESNLRKMVDEAAKAAGYVLSTFHGTSEYFNTFNMGIEGIHLGNESVAKHVANIRYNNRSKQTTYEWKDLRGRIKEIGTDVREEILKKAWYDANDYTDANIEPYNGSVKDDAAVVRYVDRVEKELGRKHGYSLYLNTFDRQVGERVVPLYAKINSPLVVNGDLGYWAPFAIAKTILDMASGKTSIESTSGRMVNITGSEVKLTKEQERALHDIEQLSSMRSTEEKFNAAWDELGNVFESMGYDGIKYKNEFEGDKNSYSYIALRPSDVKSADLVTKDDKGNIIPLSERFNTEKKDIRYSLDTDYLRLAEKYKAGTATEAETEQLQQAVAQEAKNMGFDSPKLYHGTKSFGFTQFDLKKGENLIFATSDANIAKTYSGDTDRRKISDREAAKSLGSVTPNELLRKARQYLGDSFASCYLLSEQEKQNRIESARKSLKAIANKNELFLMENADAFNQEKYDLMRQSVAALDSLSKAKTSTELYRGWLRFWDAWNKMREMDLSITQELAKTNAHDLDVAYNALDDMLTRQGNLYQNGTYILSEAELVNLIENELNRGIYSLYGKLGKSFVFDANGSSWNRLRSSAELKLGNGNTTRELAKRAFQVGYDSVIIKNVRDVGGYTSYDETGDIYIFNAKNAVKSADPVTYDDAGNIIPLSERFNQEKEDIRWSLDTDAARKARQAFTVIDTAGIEDGLEALKNVKNVGAFAMKDISRFLDAISHSSKDEEANKNLRNTLSAIFEKPHSEATGRYARGVERMQQRVLDIGVKAGVCDEKGGHFDSKKSAAIQNIGEGFSNTYTDLKLKVKDADRVTVRAYEPGTDKLVVSEKDYTLKELRQAYGTNVADFVWGRIFDETQKAQASGKEAGWLDETVNTRPYTLADLQDAFPKDWQQLKTAADEFRQMYDEYIRDQNNMLRTIYPIASEYESVEKVEKAISKKQERLTRHKVGVEQQIQNLQKSLEAKEKEMAGKKRTDTKAFRNLVEQANRITDKIAAVKAEIAEYEANINEELAVMNAEKAQMQNAVQSGESLKRMHRLQYRSDYFHHFQEMASGIQNLKAIFTNNTDISPAIVGKSENTKAKSRWAGYYQQRMGADYTADAMNGMLRYGQLAEYKLAFDPLVSYLRNVTEQIRTLDDNTNRDGLIKYLMAWTDNIAGKSHRLDRLISDAGMAPRKAMQVLNWINSRVIQNTLLFNMRSSLIQISNITNAKGIVTNNLDWFNGLRCWAAASKGNEAMQAIMAQSNFLASRYMDNMELTDSALKSAKKFAGWMLGALDEVSAKATWWAAYTQYQRNPNAKVIQNAYRAYDNAVDYADDVTRRTHAGRGVGELAPAMTSRVISFVAPFQVEINNTFELFKDNVKRRNYLGLLSTGLSVFLFNAAFEAIVGSSPLQFDFIRAVLDIVLGFKNDDPDEDDDDYGLLQAWQRIAGEGIGSLPFAGQLVSIIGEDTAKKIFGEDNDATRYGNTQIGVSAVTNAGKGLYDIGKNLIEGKNVKQVNWISDLDDLVNLTLPMGGKQLTRSIQGLYTVAQGYGGKNDKEGKEQVQFVTDQDILHYIHGGLFGKWSLTEASEYFGEERLLPKLFGEYEGPKSSIGKPVDANEYKAALAAGIDGKQFFSLKYDLKEYTTQAGKRSEMMEQSFTPEQKAKLDALLFGSKDAEMKAEGAVVYQKNSDGEWKVKADYTNRDMFELSQNGDKTYTGTLAAMEKTGLPQDQAVLAANMWDQAKQADDSKTAFRDLLRDNKNLTVAQKEALDLQYCGNKYAADYSDPDLYEISITNRSTYEKAKQAKAQGIPVKEYVGLLDKKNDYSGEDKADYMRREIMNGNLTEKQKELLDDLLVSDKGRNPDYSSPAWFEISMLGGGQYNEAKEGAKIGLKPETYLTVYGKWKTLDAKDENGKTVNGLKKKRAKEYLDSLTITAPEYDYIWTVIFGYKTK